MPSKHLAPGLSASRTIDAATANKPPRLAVVSTSGEVLAEGTVVGRREVAVENSTLRFADVSGVRIPLRVSPDGQPDAAEGSGDNLIRITRLIAPDGSPLTPGRRILRLASDLPEPYLSVGPTASARLRSESHTSPAETQHASHGTSHTGRALPSAPRHDPHPRTASFRAQHATPTRARQEAPARRIRSAQHPKGCLIVRGH